MITYYQHKVTKAIFKAYVDSNAHMVVMLQCFKKKTEEFTVNSVDRKQYSFIAHTFKDAFEIWWQRNKPYLMYINKIEMKQYDRKRKMAKDKGKWE